MYTIKQVSGLTGVSEAVLRAWESRYGIVEPTRSAGRYRLYSDEQVVLLREMAALVAAGVPASRAAATLLEAESSEPTGRVPETVGGELASQGAGNGLVGAAASLDPVALDEAIAAGALTDFEVFADTWLGVRLEEIGEAWASGDVSVAGEHFVSAGLMRAIAAVYDSAGPVKLPGKILVGLPPGARHELMLFAFATCLRRLGADSVYLGADVPTADWERAAREHRARAAVVGVTAFQKREGAAQEVVDSLSAIVPPVSVWVGGSHRHDVTGAAQLPDAPSAAAKLLFRNLLAGSA